MSVAAKIAPLPSVLKEQRRQAERVNVLHQRVQSGEPYVLCNQDEVEELCLLMDIPVLPINSWNFEIHQSKSEQYFSDLLEARGYPGPHLWELGTQSYFPLGYAAALEPARAPWNGLPRPTVIVAGGKFEMENRVMELWARQLGCPVFLMDFMFSPQLRDLPLNWHRMVTTDWDKLVDPDRLALRVEQEKSFAEWIERVTGRSFSVERLLEAMELVNRQMVIWHEVENLIADTRPCPLSLREQSVMYATVQLRGTPEGIAAVEQFLAEVRARVAEKHSPYPGERLRYHYEGRQPDWHDDMAERFGAVAVSYMSTGLTDNYARVIKNGDPFPALASRHMMLMSPTPERLIDIARRYQLDAVIVPEIHMTTGIPSNHQRTVEAAGIPYLAVPRDTADTEVKAMVTTFFEQRVVPRRSAA